MIGSNSYNSLESYRQQELTLEIQTSSGDKLELGINKETSMSYQNGPNGQELSSSTLQEMKFSYQGNGIDAQDQKEIDAIMELAQPIIDEFMKSLEEGNNSTPLNQSAREVSNIFLPLKEDTQVNPDKMASAKNALIDATDSILRTLEQNKEYSKQAQSLLEQIFSNIDGSNIEIYA